MKLFRSFIDLPPTYYSKNNSESISEEDNLHDGQSIEDVGKIMISILKQFVQNPTFLQRLLHEDTFFMLIRILTSKPANNDSVAKDSEPMYIRWKERLIAVLESMTFSEDVCQYLYHRRCVNLLTTQWAETISSKNKLTIADHHEILIGLRLLTCLFRQSSKARSYILFDQMIQSSGYVVIRDMVYKGPYEGKVLDLKTSSIN
ncbi:hypothetical protein BDF20DRAFT_195207 [Mycotypha africana]|uniref:uncharacterized protein n=1 Tax=Mycotypha africana TaxID=64632 RepID=UPI0023019EBB|nr:uncharacterized protein BDF20DRAFT_195207 [Mycotypha africana]KAI8967887.1 hypothetical protein BDF20DRAFT_195207 [Mycotypha africana]